MMKLLSVLLITLLFLQACLVLLADENGLTSDASSSPHDQDENGGGDLESLVKKSHVPQYPSSAHRIDCGRECARRCSKARRKNLCHRACGTCCARCNCVPPGTYGNTHLCPCYARQRTHRNRLKCP